MDFQPEEPFRSAILANRAATVCDAGAAGAEALTSRGLARLRGGRAREARADFEAALGHEGRGPWRDVCRVELACLDIQERRDVSGAVETVERLRDSTEDAGEESSALRARLLHVLGLGEAKLGRTVEAVQSLVRARALYSAHGDRLAYAHVQDTLGMVYKSKGQLDLAAGFYAQSLVEKMLAEDLVGAAITLGNLGRLHLEAGRYEDALSCFEQDLRLAEAVGDERGRAQMYEDMGRACLAQGELERAEEHLERCLELAAERGYTDLAFFAHKDLARVTIAAECLAETRRHLALAEAALSDGAEPYHDALLLAVRGEFYAARGDRSALTYLEDAARRFAAADLPDLEIATLIELAGACPRLIEDETEARRRAEGCLRAALRRANQGGFTRHLRRIREEFLRLGLAAGLVEERDRLTQAGQPAAANGYTILGLLGTGGFGSVHRAFDPVHDRLVAIKLLALNNLYDAGARAKCLRSAKNELAAASRVDHPGVARVHAIGTDDQGRTYVAQELVDGPCLRTLMGQLGSTNPGRVVETVGQIAQALDALHRAGVLHRDLKPENVIVRSADRRPVLIDFGVAYVPTFRDTYARGSLTGTLPYMAPEHLAGAEISGKADVFSLGVVFYEWLVGERPRQRLGPTVRAQLEHLRTQEPTPITEHTSALPEPLTTLVMAMLARSPAERPTAAEVAARCRELAPAVLQATAAGSAAGTDPAAARHERTLSDDVDAGEADATGDENAAPSDRRQEPPTLTAL